jgi:hypothetical protein
MISTLSLGPVIKRVERTVRKRNATLVKIVPAAALMAAFGYLVSQEPVKSPVHLYVVVTATLTAVILQVAAKSFGHSWIREWCLAISMTVGLLTAGLAA